MRASLLALAVLGVACGGSSGSSGATTPEDVSDFECNARAAEFTVTGGFGAAEMGVRLACTDTAASVTRWSVEASGTKKQKQASVPVGVFDAFWKRIESTGWQQLKDCANGAADKNDPVYQFEIKDRSDTVDFSCQGKRQQLPFPYDSLVNELDTAARNHIRS